MSAPPLQPASRELQQTVIWTVLPQGFVPGRTDKVRLAVLVTPQLAFKETIGARSVTSGNLANFPDWANWPATLAQGIKFHVGVGLIGKPVNKVALVGPKDPTLANSSYWSAVFNPANTRVDAPVAEDYSGVEFTTYNATKASRLMATSAPNTTTDPTVPPVSSAPPGGVYGLTVQPGVIFQSDPNPGVLSLVHGQPPKDSTGANLTAAGYAYEAVKPHFKDPTSDLSKAVAFHQPLVPLVPDPATSNPVLMQLPPLAPPPVIDFHTAVAALAAHPELLVYFGLVIPLEVDVSDLQAGGVSSVQSGGGEFVISVSPNLTPPAVPADSSGPTTIDIKLQTRCTLDAAAGLMAVPFGSDYVNGQLSLGDTTGAVYRGPLSISDIDIDGAVENLNAFNLTIESALFSQSEAEEFEVSATLPHLRSTGPALFWSDWGLPLGKVLSPSGQPNSGSRGTTLNLSCLTKRQTAIQTGIQTAISAAISSGAATLGPTLFAEDLTRGWRLDVAKIATALGPAPCGPGSGTAYILADFVSSPTWQSLHWRNGTFTFGADGEQISPAPVEGMVVPAVTHAPLAEGETVPQSQVNVHEALIRWDGWSLSAPRPFGQVNDDGMASPSPVASDMPSTSLTDVAGNINPQISASFTNPPAGQPVNDLVYPTVPIGTTGLPTLRFGASYQYRVRSVDLSGWSLPQSSGASSSTPFMLVPGGAPAFPQAHYRWEPVHSPLVVPVAPLTAGEGAHTIVLRDDGVTPPRANARWLFPPKVHEQFAEEHGAFDDPITGVPDTNAFVAAIKTFGDGSLGTIPGVVPDPTAAGAANLILPTFLPADNTAPKVEGPPITWLPDPAAWGVSVAGAGFIADGGAAYAANGVPTVIPQSAISQQSSVGLDGCNTALPPAMTDLALTVWAPEPGGTWPELMGKLLEITPITPNFENFVPNIAEPLGPPAFTPAGSFFAGSVEVLGLAAAPAGVYELQLSSILPFVGAGPAAAATPPLPGAVAGLSGNASDVFGVAAITEAARPLVMFGNPEHGQTTIPPVPLLFYGYNSASYYPHITPSKRLLVVYAVLKPRVAPAFSDSMFFLRAQNDTLVSIYDKTYIVDGASTSRITYTATWADPVDNPNDSSNDPRTDTVAASQSGLVATVASPYAAAPVITDPLVPKSKVKINAPQPFGAIEIAAGEASAVFNHRIGDTKHHLVTYAGVATSRFGKFFSETSTVILGDVSHPVTLDSRGVDANSVVVVLPGLPIASVPPVTVPAGLYTIDASSGQIWLPDPTVTVSQTTDNLSVPVLLLGASVDVTYVPTDTLPGPSQPPFHVPSSSNPPPLKIAKVSPAWTLSQGQQEFGYGYTRAGNTLRVYLERPWWTTGADEMVGVVSLKHHTGSTPGVQANALPKLVSVLGFDPISVSSHDPGATYTQAQLRFVTDPTVVTFAGGVQSVPLRLPLLEDPAAGDDSYVVWPYTPSYDPISALWYVDVKLDLLEDGSDSPPPGYFLRLALVRFQPYTCVAASMISPVTLVTFAQPVPDRTVSVVPTANGHRLGIIVSGPGYYGFRPAPANPRSDGIVMDDANTFAQHPNSDGRGAPATSAMIVEVQFLDDSEGFGGDFGWSTLQAFTTRLTPEFSGGPIVSWSGFVDKPTDSGQLRLRISELDYYTAPGTPTVVDTSRRRSFVAHIPL